MEAFAVRKATFTVRKRAFTLRKETFTLRKKAFALLKITFRVMKEDFTAESAEGAQREEAILCVLSGLCGEIFFTIIQPHIPILD